MSAATQRFNFVVGQTYPEISCYGCGTDPGKTSNVIDNVEKEALQKLNLNGAPLTIDHPPLNKRFKDSPDIGCGQVIHTFMHNGDQWAMAVMKDGFTKKHQAIFEKIRRGENVELSLGLNYSDLRSPTGEIINKKHQVDHLALVDKGRRPGCHAYTFATEKTMTLPVSEQQVNEVMSKIDSIPRRTEYIVNSSDGSQILETSNRPETCDLGTMFTEKAVTEPTGSISTTTNTTETSSLSNLSISESSFRSFLSDLSKNKTESVYKPPTGKKMSKHVADSSNTMEQASLPPFPSLPAESGASGNGNSQPSGTRQNTQQMDASGNTQAPQPPAGKKGAQQMNESQTMQGNQQASHPPPRSEEKDTQAQKKTASGTEKPSQQDQTEGAATKSKEGTKKMLFTPDQVKEELSTKSEEERARDFATLANELAEMKAKALEIEEQQKEYEMLKQQKNERDKEVTTEAANLIFGIVNEFIGPVDESTQITPALKQHHEDCKQAHGIFNELFEKLPDSASRLKLATGLNMCRELATRQTQALSVASAEQGRQQSLLNEELVRPLKRKRGAGDPSIEDLIRGCTTRASNVRQSNTMASSNSGQHEGWQANTNQFGGLPDLRSAPASMAPAAKQTHNPYQALGLDPVSFIQGSSSQGDAAKLGDSHTPKTYQDSNTLTPRSEHGWDFSQANLAGANRSKISEFVPLDPRMTY